MPDIQNPDQKNLPDESILRQALEIAFAEAQQAFYENEVPVGAVIIFENRIIARDHNRTIQARNALRHAEMLVLEKAFLQIKNERLTECHLVTSLEPCLMCSGSIIWSRISSVHFLAEDEKNPALRDVTGMNGINHKPQLFRHHSEEWDSAALLKRFFQNRR